MNRSRRPLWQTLGCAACLSASVLARAATTDAVQTELEQIKLQRQSVESDHDLLDQQCLQQLAANACQKTVRLNRIEALRPLDQRRRELQGKLRKEKADTQRARVKEREKQKNPEPETSDIQPPAQPQPQPLTESLP